MRLVAADRVHQIFRGDGPDLQPHQGLAVDFQRFATTLLAHIHSEVCLSLTREASAVPPGICNAVMSGLRRAPGVGLEHDPLVPHEVTAETASFLLHHRRIATLESGAPEPEATVSAGGR